MSGARGSRWKALLVIAAIVLCLLAGVAMTHGIRVQTTVGGREITGETANVLTVGTLSSDGTTVRVELGIPMTAQVTKDSVVLSDGTSLPIPAACKHVELKVEDGRLRVLLDGVAAN
jgi:hypothetical protein